MRKNRSYGTASHEYSTTRHSLSSLVRVSVEVYEQGRVATDCFGKVGGGEGLVVFVLELDWCVVEVEGLMLCSSFCSYKSTGG